MSQRKLESICGLVVVFSLYQAAGNDLHEAAGGDGCVCLEQSLRYRVKMPCWNTGKKLQSGTYKMSPQPAEAPSMNLAPCPYYTNGYSVYFNNTDTPSGSGGVVDLQNTYVDTREECQSLCNSDCRCAAYSYGINMNCILKSKVQNARRTPEYILHVRRRTKDSCEQLSDDFQVRPAQRSSSGDLLRIDNVALVGCQALCTSLCNCVGFQWANGECRVLESLPLEAASNDLNVYIRSRKASPPPPSPSPRPFLPPKSAPASSPVHPITSPPPLPQADEPAPEPPPPWIRPLAIAVASAIVSGVIGLLFFYLQRKFVLLQRRRENPLADAVRKVLKLQTVDNFDVPPGHDFQSSITAVRQVLQDTHCLNKNLLYEYSSVAGVFAQALRSRYLENEPLRGFTCFGMCTHRTVRREETSFLQDFIRDCNGTVKTQIAGDIANLLRQGRPDLFTGHTSRDGLPASPSITRRHLLS